MKAFMIILSLLMFFSCGQELESELVNSYQSENSALRWDQSDLPVKVALSDNWSQEIQGLSEDAFSQWEDAAGIQFFDDFDIIENKEFYSLKDYYYKDKDHNGVYLAKHRVEELAYNYLAVCQVFAVPKIDENENIYFRILHGDIVFNGYYHDFSMNEEDHDKYDIGNVLLHELGHFLGLKHSPDGDGIMKSGAGSIANKDRVLEAPDISSIYDLYHNQSEAQSYAVDEISSNPKPDNMAIRVLLKQRLDNKLEFEFEFVPL